MLCNISRGILSYQMNEMKCGLFNDPFDYYGHIGSGNGNRLHKLLGNIPKEAK